MSFGPETKLQVLPKNKTRAWCGATALAGDREQPQIGSAFNAPNIAYSLSPNGPWNYLEGRSSWGADNPASVFLSNGSVLLFSKFSCNDTLNPHGAPCYQYGLMRAESWRGPWKFIRMIEVFGEDVAA